MNEELMKILRNIEHGYEVYKMKMKMKQLSQNKIQTFFFTGTEIWFFTGK